MWAGEPRAWARTLAAPWGVSLLTPFPGVSTDARADPPGLGLWCRAPMQLCPLARVSVACRGIFVIKSGLLLFRVLAITFQSRPTPGGERPLPSPCEPGIPPSGPEGGVEKTANRALGR